ncbi:MAG: tetratricopeptide repeat protein [Pseudomonadota bacterium]
MLEIHRIPLLVSLLLLSWLALGSTAAVAAEVAEAADAPLRPLEATSFGGQPLYRYDIPVEKRAEVYERIAALEAKADKSEQDYITLGYLYIEVGQFQGAIDLYTRGLEAVPTSFKLLRHRGHRYLNVRQLDQAIADLERALELLGDDNKDVVQYRLSGEPFGTYEHWIWYHVALYHYLNGDYAAAAAGYERCVETATANAMLIGAVDWLWNSYQKNGEPEKAKAALARVPADIDIRPGYAYFRRVQLYQGLADPTELIDLSKPGLDWNGLDITLGYGVANWYALQGDSATAQKIFDKILKGGVWNAWAYVATDREQARRGAEVR